MKRKTRKILIRIPVAPPKRTHRSKKEYNRKPKHRRKYNGSE